MAESFETAGDRAASAWYLAARLAADVTWPVTAMAGERGLLLFPGKEDDTVRAVAQACPSCGTSREESATWDPANERMCCRSCGAVEVCNAEGGGYPVMRVDDEVYVYVEPE
jgi:hypothetical protein